jgi:hypothetical protein
LGTAPVYLFVISTELEVEYLRFRPPFCLPWASRAVFDIYDDCQQSYRIEAAVMKIAVQNPMLRSPQGLTYLGACVVFAEQYADVLYMPHMAAENANLVELARAGNSIMSDLNGRSVEVIFEPEQLNKAADVLVCFNGVPFLPENRPPKEFHGMKVFHGMDYATRPTESHEIFVEGGVDYMLGYARHDLYDPFFAQVYPKYLGRVIAMPFGAGDRFFVDNSFKDRDKRVIGLGTINPVRSPTAQADISELISFFSGETWSHKWRALLLENRQSLADIFEDRFPTYPEIHNFTYDAVVELAGHMMFANDESIHSFPPARTYEGVAAGAALIGAKHPCYEDLGFVDGVNCVMHEPLDVADFRRVVEQYLSRLDELESVAAAGRDLVRERYSHTAVARSLRYQLESFYQRS